MHLASIAQLKKQLHSRTISARELTQHFLDRIRQHAALNSFITVCADTALAQAEAIDAQWSTFADAPLLGIPIAHKDNFCTRNTLTSCGSKMLANYKPPFDATVVCRLHAAGAITLGKTNMDEFAMGSSNETSYYGAVKNPWNRNHVPGGSSGGSAAAVAAALVPAATGSDTGGSIRQPAAFCGVTGIKPTYGRVSRYGLVAFASSLDQAGVLTRSAEDAAWMLQAMAGHDPKDATASHQTQPNYVETLCQPVRDVTIGLPTAYFQADLNPELAAKLAEAQHELKQLGIRFQAVDFQYSDAAMATYYTIASAECASNLARYDGIRFGYQTNQAHNLEEYYRQTRTTGFGQEVKRRILLGTHTLSSGYHEAYYQQATKVRQLILEDYLQAFNTVDLVLCPTTPETAFQLGQKIADPVAMYLSDLYTTAVNLAGLPAINVPCGFLNGLPVGYQLVGPHFAESLLLRVAHHYQTVTDWHQRRPEGY